ncbi:aquaporin [Planctomycetota bacterium]|nr:aquaporin [Planctomycetota bacterium]
MNHVNLFRACIAECIGTFILVFFGIGAVHAAVLTEAQSGLWQVAVVWGIAIAIAIYAVGAISGAHINPAITIAFTIFKKFPIKRVPVYIASQLIGAFAGALVLYALFKNFIKNFEANNSIMRGGTGSELSAMIYGEYFPNPAIAKALNWSSGIISHEQAMLAEGIGTAFLAFFVFALTDRRNGGGPGNRLQPVLIGLSVSIIISIVAPLTQAGLNPARDFGPRFFAWLMGWGSIAIPGPRNGFFTVYILAPILGALCGGGLYKFVLSKALTQESDVGLVNELEDELVVAETIGASSERSKNDHGRWIPRGG